MRRKLAFLLTLALLLAVLPGGFGFTQTTEVIPLGPAPIYADEGMVNETPAFWFVQLSGAPVADGGRLASIRNEKASFRTAVAAAQVQMTERFSFDILWNGISVAAAGSELAKIARLPGVTAIYPVEIIPIPETDSGSPDLFTALSMTGADAAQSELGYTGAGIKVAVMDTGVDYDHPDLGGGFGPGHKVYTGWDFVGDAFNADPTHPGYNPVPAPDPDPDDVNGHGTHVAGIIGANGTVRGVAPGCLIGAYRVFGAEGSTTAEIMILAMERILADKMQVLNMSIGSAYQWPNYPTAQAADRLVNRGVVVVASIGNNGANGLYSAGAPGLGSKVIGVASFDNTHVTLRTFTISPDDMAIGYANAAAAPLSPVSGTTEIMAAADLTGAAPGGNYDGKIAIVARGTSTFHSKALIAQQQGATAVIIHNNVAGSFSPTVAGTPEITIPVVAITQSDGQTIVSRLAGGPVHLTWTDNEASFPSPTGGLISSFSSYGLSPDLALKPDIGAPGGNIYSTYPLEKGEYATLSGTSMSSPHVAGAVALFLQAKPKTPPVAVRTALLNSADPKNWWGNPGLGFLDNVHRQGAGMLDIDDAILATTLVEPSKLSLGESEAGPHSVTLVIDNKAKTAVTYDLSYVNALSTGGLITPGFFTSNASVEFGSASISVPARGTSSLVATIYPASGPEFGQYGGYIVLTPQGGGQVYRVPFAGFVGDYQGIQVLTPTIYGFPALGWSPDGVNFGFAAAGDIFTMQGYDVPYVLARFEHQSALARIEVMDAISGRSWHVAFEEKFMPRNSTTTGFFALPFDGTTTAGKKLVTVPDGTYVLRLSVLKALGDPANPAHWEIWTSPPFVIDRP